MACCHLAAATFIFLPLKHVSQFFSHLAVEGIWNGRDVLLRCRGQQMIIGTEGCVRLFWPQPLHACFHSSPASGVATKLHSMPLPDSMGKDRGSSVSSLLLPAYPYWLDGKGTVDDGIDGLLWRQRLFCNSQGIHQIHRSMTLSVYQTIQ